MNTMELLTLAGIAVTFLLAQRTQINSLFQEQREALEKRMSGIEARVEDSEDGIHNLDLRLTTVETVCKMRQTNRAEVN